MISSKNLSSLTSKLNQFSENGRFQVSGMGGRTQSVTYIPANSQGTDDFSHAMSTADELSQILKRTGDLTRFAKIEDQKPDSRDIRPASGKVVLPKLSDEEVDTGFSGKVHNEFTATSLEYEPGAKTGSSVVRGLGMEGLKTLDFEYVEKYENGRVSEDPERHQTYRIGVNRLVSEDLVFNIRQGGDALGLNVSPTGALTVL